MIESYVLDITPFSLTLVELMRKDELAQALASQNRPVKLRGMVNMMNYTYGLVFSFEKGNYPTTMRWGMYLSGKREATALLSASSVDALHSRIVGRCIIPANWYYDTDTPTENYTNVTSGILVERKRKKERIWIGAERIGEKLAHFPENGDPCNFGAVYTLEEGIPCFALIIMDDGLPLMVPRNLLDNWTNPEGDPRSVISKRIRDIRQDITN